MTPFIFSKDEHAHPGLELDRRLVHISQSCLQFFGCSSQLQRVDWIAQLSLQMLLAAASVSQIPVGSSLFPMLDCSFCALTVVSLQSSCYSDRSDDVWESMCVHVCALVVLCKASWSFFHSPLRLYGFKTHSASDPIA